MEGATVYREFADEIEPEAVFNLSLVAVSECMPESLKEVWRRRRDAVLHRVRVAEMNLDYDIDRFCPKSGQTVH